VDAPEVSVSLSRSCRYQAPIKTAASTCCAGHSQILLALYRMVFSPFPVGSCVLSLSASMKPALSPVDRGGDKASHKDTRGFTDAPQPPGAPDDFSNGTSGTHLPM
jgi:hypothetical protein